MNLNNTCIHNVSDEDCNKCMIHGILLKCPEGCKDYNRGNRKTKSEYMKEQNMFVLVPDPEAEVDEAFVSRIEILKASFEEVFENTVKVRLP